MATPVVEQDLPTLLTKTPPRSNKRAVSVLPKKSPGFSCQSIVTVEAGPEKKSFMVHKDLLTFYSDYFRGALNGSFREAIESKISLPDVCVETMELFVHFIYNRCLADGAGHKLSWEQLVEVWLFGDKHLIPSLQNSAMDALIMKNKTENVIPTKNVKVIYENTLSSSPLRKFILDLVTYIDIDRLMDTDNGSRWSHESLMDLARALYHKRTVKPVRGNCYYHVHNAGEKC